MRFDARQQLPSEFDTGEVTGAQARRQLRQRFGMQAHSMTFGTRYKDAAICGALA